MSKTFSIDINVWTKRTKRSRYVAWFYDGASKNRDGSPALQLRLFANQREAITWATAMRENGYTGSINF